jgi:translation initiation factor 3 subunit G
MRLGGKNWADVDEEDDVDETSSPTAQSGARFETQPDVNGIKQVIEYKERDSKTYKVTKRVRVTRVTKWTNAEMGERKNLEKFGKGKTEPHGLPNPEDAGIEVCKRQVQLTQTNDAEDKFLEEALLACENLFKEKKVWTDVNRDKQVERDTTEPPKADAASAAPAAAAATGGADAPKKYVPPSIRAQEGKGGGKGDLSAQQEASLRITNLSEDVKEGDLQELFGQFGSLQRVYLAKDPATMLSKGFAFVTYYDREKAQKAINKLNGHGYDNLILQVQWAKPRGP